MIRRWDAPDEQLLRRILASPPPPLDSTPLRARAVFFREIYFDTSGGDLRQRGARCRLRFVVDGTTSLTVWLAGGPRVRSRLPSLALSQGDAIATLAGDSPAAARLRALVDPTRLESWIERDVERIWRTRRVPFFRVPLYDLAGDVVTVRRQELTARFAELAVCPRPWGGGAAGRLASELEAAFPLRPAGNDPVLRAQAALDGVEGEAIGRELRGEREVAVIAVEHGRIGLCRSGGTDLRVPVQRGSGEEACRAALREIVGTGEGQLRLLGVVPRSGDRVPLEVWTARRLHRNPNNGDRLQWFDPAELIARVGSPMLRDPGTLAALTVAARSPLLPEWSGAPFDTGETPIDRPPTTREDVARASRVTLSELRALVRSDEVKDPARQSPDQFLNPELSWLEFNSRVLTLAEDQATPAAARLRFLGIFSTNLDQFVMTRIGALKQLVAAGHNARSPHGGGLRPQETLDAIAIRLRPLLERQYRAFHSLEPLLGLQQWEQLSEDERA
ncbi:MAG TPA: hypothetical protein VG454_11285, partial [Gemmatimonadales bacterium]|nr:hypothetical protein [Gemmatimonadales bacterium]